jgi:hypothetical protein
MRPFVLRSRLRRCFGFPARVGVRSLPGRLRLFLPSRLPVGFSFLFLRARVLLACCPLPPLPVLSAALGRVLGLPWRLPLVWVFPVSFFPRLVCPLGGALPPWVGGGFPFVPLLPSFLSFSR